MIKYIWANNTLGKKLFKIADLNPELHELCASGSYISPTVIVDSSQGRQFTQDFMVGVNLRTLYGDIRAEVFLYDRHFKSVARIWNPDTQAMEESACYISAAQYSGLYLNGRAIVILKIGSHANFNKDRLVKDELTRSNMGKYVQILEHSPDICDEILSKIKLLHDSKKEKAKR